MAKQNRTILKNYFQTGDKPSQSEYADLIDSQLNLEDTSAQIVKGPISGGAEIITNDLQGRSNVTTRISLENTSMDFLVNDVDIFNLSAPGAAKFENPLALSFNDESESADTNSSCTNKPTL